MVIDIELTLNRFGFRKISENKFQLFCFRFSKWEIPKDRKSTRLNSSHSQISYAVFCLKKKKITNQNYDAAKANEDETASALKSYQEKHAQVQCNVHGINEELDQVQDRFKHVQDSVHNR